MTRLRIRLLGTPEIHHDERLVSFRTRKALALLIYLVVEEGSHSREKLATLLWPESDPSAGRATLRSTLRYLRAPLDHSTENGLAHLTVARGTLGFNFDAPHALDLDAVEAAADSRSDAGVTLLQQAVEAHRGYFLEGFSLPDAPEFEEWATFQRERWHLRLSEIYGRLAEAEERMGHVSRAIETATRWVAFDPLQEEAYRSLMRLQMAAGNRPAAQQTYEACRRTLAEELAVEPAPETQALARRILDRDGADRPRIPSDRSAGERASEHASTATLPAQPPFPFIGRGQQHAKLVEAYYRCEKEGAAVAIVEGEAGIGKTRLAREFLRWATARDAIILRGRAFETGGRLPYQPLVEALRPVTPRLPDLLSPSWLGELSRILPEVTDLTDEVPAPAGGDDLGRARLFEAVARCGIALSAGAPVVLFVDDLQWADAATMDLLTYAVRRWRERQSPILLLGAVRAEALHRAAPVETLLEWLGDLERRPGVMRVELETLAAAEIAGLVERLSHPDEARERLGAFSRWLFRETRGQPFYLTETLKALLEEEILVYRPVPSGETRFRFSAPVAESVSWSEAHPLRGFVPPGVRDLVRDRLARLPSAAFDLLVAGAILGQEFDFSALCHVADLSRGEGLPVLDQLLAARLLEESTQKERPYTFSHDKIRDVVYTEAGDARRQLFHERALSFLEAAGAPAARLAHHAYHSGAHQSTVRHSLRAGEEAMALFAVRDAIVHFEQARRVLLEHPSLGEEIESARRRQLYERLGRGYELINEWDDAVEIYREMLADARAAENPEMEVAALNRLATVRVIWKLDPDGALALVEEARDVAEACGDRRGLAEAEWCACLSKFYRFDRPSSLKHGRRAIALARELEEKELIARCLNVTGYAASGVNLWKDMERFGAEAEALYAELGDRAMEVDSLLLVASARINIGRTASAATLARRGLEISEEIENEWGEANAVNHLAVALLDAGHYGEAFRTVQRVYGLPQLEDAPQYMGGLTVRGMAYWAVQAFEKALADHLAADEHIHRLGNPGMLRVLSVHLCADYAALERWEKAYEFACTARQTKDFGWYYAGFKYWSVTEALVRGGDLSVAERDIGMLEEAVGEVDRYRIVIQRSRGVLEKWRRNEAAAVEHFQNALQLADSLELPGEQWPLLAELETLYRSLGDERAATAAAARAGQIVHALAESIEDPALRDGFLAAAAGS